MSAARSLLLNASFEPLCVLSSRRALVLVLTGKAVVVHESDEVFRSERLHVKSPSVIRMRYYVRVPYRNGVALNRRSVFIRDGGRCQYCDSAAESIDHVVPRSRGGRHVWENVVAACRSCNTRKRDRLLEETSFVLRSRPREPHVHALLLALAEAADSSWLSYLQPKMPTGVAAQVVVSV